MDYRKYPIFRVLIFLILGILLAYSGTLSSVTPIMALVSSVCFCIISSIIYHKTTYQWQWTAGVGVLLAALFVGFGLTKFRLSPTFSPSLEQYIQQNRNYVVTIVEPPEVRAKSVKMKVLLEKSLEDTIVLQPCMLYLARDSMAVHLRYGDRILINSQIKDIEPPKNPDAFDYRAFMRRKGVYFTGYVPACQWQKIDSGHVHWLRAKSYQLQQYFSRQFALAGVAGDEYAVITAILLGNDETMEPDLRARYASAGVSHILCVSGMHVGIIYMILNFLLKPLDLYRRSRYAKALLLVGFIWLYAHITGLSPSVTRAATMFTFVALGGLLRRPTDIFHSLYASLFILLIINPLLLFETGFQLSYLAVFGIVIFQPKIASWLKPRTRTGKYFNELASVSLAAQLTTFPVSVHCFGQFPNYFLLANLSVIALSFAVVVTGVALLAVSFWPTLATCVGYILGFEIKSMNSMIGWINELPGAVSDNLKLDLPQVLLIYLAILMLVFFFKTARKPALWVGLAACALLPLTILYDKYQQSNKQELIVYQINKNTAISFQDGSDGILLADSAIWPGSGDYNFNIKNHERQSRLSSRPVALQETLFIEGAFAKIGQFVRFQNVTLCLLQRGQWLYPTANPPQVDYLVLCHSPQASPEKVAAALNFKHVVLDGSNTPYYCEKWRQYCSQQQIPVHSTAELGFLRIAVGIENREIADEKYF